MPPRRNGHRAAGGDADAQGMRLPRQGPGVVQRCAYRGKGQVVPGAEVADHGAAQVQAKMRRRHHRIASVRQGLHGLQRPQRHVAGMPRRV